MNIVKKIQENIFHHELFPRGAKIVVGVSGGPDSVCLLEILYKLKDKYDLRLIIAHVNYGLRGKDSQRDEKFVRELAKKYALPIEIKKFPRSAFSACLPVGKVQRSEEYLRNLRYSFFKEVRKKHKANLIAVAHNRDDQAETVLMRIIRGAGLRGLGAIQFRNNHIIRPLLNIPRKEILAYLRKNRLPYRTDRTNFTDAFTRNKIRNKLLPYIEKNFNPKVRESLYNLSRSAAADYDFINRYAGELLSSGKQLSVSALNRLHPSIRREAIRLAIERHVPGLREIGSAHVDEILKIMQSNKSKRQKTAFQGLKIERINDNLIIRK